MVLVTRAVSLVSVGLLAAGGRRRPLQMSTPGGAAAATPAASAADAQRSVKLIPGLRAREFQHPLDKQASEALKLLAPVEWGLRQAFSTFVEDSIFMENIASAVLVGPRQLPELHKALLDSCRLLGLETAPDLYIRQSPSPNAYTLAIQGRRPFVVCTTALLDLMTPLEVQAVIAHELGHLKCEHSLSLAMANLVLSPLASVLPVGGAASLQGSLLRWQRAAELTCDRAALLVVQDVRTVQSVTMKLSGGSKSYAQRMDVEAFVDQAKAYEDVATSSRQTRLVRRSQERDSTHPLPVLRVREIERFAVSPEYARLLARGKPVTLRRAEGMGVAVAGLAP